MPDPEHSKPLTSVAQSENRAGGDVVGGNKNTTNLAIGSVSPTDAITRLLERLIREQKADVQAQTIIDELKRFQVPQEPVPVGLEQKLKDGCREDIIHFATTAKQEFAKKLAKETLFESAQEIHALVLSRIYCMFSTQISPAIKTGADRLAVDALIRAQIIDPIVAELQNTPFRYYDEHVYGMIFYLTGNCYLKWK
jgi:hypothetical protein